MRTLISIFALSALVACGGSEPVDAPKPGPAKTEVKTKAKAPAPAKTEAVAAFDAEAAFKTTCGPCHGEVGAGDGVAGAALNPKPVSFAEAAFWDETRTDDHLKKVIKEGGASVGKSPMMAAFGNQFDDAQIDALVKHLKSFKP